MSSLAARLTAAIKASGKTLKEIGAEAGVNPEHVGRLARGEQDNPGIQVLSAIATAVNTTLGELLGLSFATSTEDERELLRFRGWIDSKLPKIDARQEPNATIVSTASSDGQSRVAEGSEPADEINHPFDAKVHLQLRALGESMVGEGILPDDLLYAIPPVRNDPTSVLEKIIACRLGEGIFVKRLVTEHGRLYLRSGDPRYRPIRIDAKDTSFEVLGIVIGRVGRID
jgi:transcriptional regulator with XRE-family HTH domain